MAKQLCRVVVVVPVPDSMSPSGGLPQLLLPASASASACRAVPVLPVPALPAAAVALAVPSPSRGMAAQKEARNADRMHSASSGVKDARDGLPRLLTPSSSSPATAQPMTWLCVGVSALVPPPPHAAPRVVAPPSAPPLPAASRGGECGAVVSPPGPRRLGRRGEPPHATPPSRLLCRGVPVALLPTLLHGLLRAGVAPGVGVCASKRCRDQAGGGGGVHDRWAVPHMHTCVVNPTSCNTSVHAHKPCIRRRRGVPHM